MRGVGDAVLWTLREAATTRLEVILFPHAGGTVNSMTSLARCFPDWVRVRAMEYGGRGRRIRLPLPSRISEMAEEAAAAILQQQSGPAVLFGHSMGALVAYETSTRLDDEGKPPLLTIFSSSRPPHIRPRLPRPSPEGVVESLRLLNGTESELLADPDFLAVGLRPFEGDLQACHDYFVQQPRAISSLAVVYGGLKDRFVSRDELDAWSAVTGSRTPVRMFPGDHFYFQSHGHLVAETVVRDAFQRGRSDVRS